MAEKNGAATKETTSTQTLELTRLPKELTERAREIWLAGLGALSRLEEEGDRVFSDLVKRGEAYESKRRGQLDDATQSIRSQQEKLTKDVTSRFDEAQKSVEKAVSDTLSGALGRVGVPTRDEVRGLSEKVGELSHKLDALAATLDAGASAPVQEKAAPAEAAEATETEETILHVVPHEEGWAVMQEGAEPALSIHETKKEAVSAGRQEAKAHAPSELVVHKQDRSVQETFSYDADA